VRLCRPTLMAEATAFYYQVTGHVRPEDVSVYADWLRGGHSQELVDRGGALSARVEQGDVAREDGRFPVRSIYVFPSKAQYDFYVREVAPELRADGLKRFGPESERPVEFSRETRDLTPEEVSAEMARDGVYTKPPSSSSSV
jgi:hypothetical protein